MGPDWTNAQDKLDETNTTTAPSKQQKSAKSGSEGLFYYLVCTPKQRRGNLSATLHLRKVLAVAKRPAATYR
jgi:hypothetical protein